MTPTQESEAERRAAIARARTRMQAIRALTEATGRLMREVSTRVLLRQPDQSCDDHRAVCLIPATRTRPPGFAGDNPLSYRQGPGQLCSPGTRLEFRA